MKTFRARDARRGDVRDGLGRKAQAKAALDRVKQLQAARKNAVTVLPAYDPRAPSCF